MEDENLSPSYPERKPEAGLLSLEDLYSWQPDNIRLERVWKLRQWIKVSKWMINRCQMEQIERLVGIESPTEAFINFHESVKEVRNETIEKFVDYEQDLILTLMSHLAIASLTSDKITLSLKYLS